MTMNWDECMADAKNLSHLLVSECWPRDLTANILDMLRYSRPSLHLFSERILARRG